MSFASRLTRHPIPHAPDRGAEAWGALHDLPPELRPLITGAAGSSPYLCGLITREAQWLSHAILSEPEDVITDLVAAAAGLAPPISTAGCGG